MENRDSGRGRIGLESAADLIPVHIREIHLQEDQVGILPDQLKSLAAAGSLQDGEPGLVQDGAA